jgi:hypothetical protein
MTPALLAVGLPDLDRLRELLERIKELLVTGGIALALAASLVFLLAWVLSHLRRPSVAGQSHTVLCTGAMLLSWIPAGLTGIAAVGIFVPTLAPFILKAFALAIVAAGFTWCIAVAAIVVGGTRQNLSRARRALLVAGTPWYCLAIYLATYL